MLRQRIRSVSLQGRKKRCGKDLPQRLSTHQLFGD
jgi:hypothetical protein